MKIGMNKLGSTRAAALLMLLGMAALLGEPLAARELGSNVKLVQAIISADSAGAVTSAAIDCTGYQEALVLADVGIIDPNGTLTIVAQSSATSGGSYVDITGATFGTLDPNTDVAVYKGRIIIDPDEPFLKLVATATVGALRAAVVLLGNKMGALPAQAPTYSVVSTD